MTLFLVLEELLGAVRDDEKVESFLQNLQGYGYMIIGREEYNHMMEIISEAEGEE